MGDLLVGFCAIVGATLLTKLFHEKALRPKILCGAECWVIE